MDQLREHNPRELSSDLALLVLNCQQTVICSSSPDMPGPPFWCSASIADESLEVGIAAAWVPCPRAQGFNRLNFDCPRWICVWATFPYMLESGTPIIHSISTNHVSIIFRTWNKWKVRIRFYSPLWLGVLAWATGVTVAVPPTFLDWVADVCAMATAPLPVDSDGGTPAVSRQREPAQVWMPVANTSGMLFRRVIPQRPHCGQCLKFNE